MSTMTKDEFRTAFFLGERWSNQDKSISDLACNVFADKVVLLDILLENTEDEQMKQDLKMVRDIIKKRGEAIWIMKSDAITNLSVKVGMKMKKVSLKGKK